MITVLSCASVRSTVRVSKIMQSLIIEKLANWTVVSTSRTVSSRSYSVFCRYAIPGTVINRFHHTGGFQRFCRANFIYCLRWRNYGSLYLLFHALPPTNFWFLLKGLPPSSCGARRELSLDYEMLCLWILLGFWYTYIRWGIVIHCYTECSGVGRLFTRVYASYLNKKNYLFYTWQRMSTAQTPKVVFFELAKSFLKICATLPPPGCPG